MKNIIFIPLLFAVTLSYTQVQNVSLIIGRQGGVTEAKHGLIVDGSFRPPVDTPSVSEVGSLHFINNKWYGKKNDNIWYEVGGASQSSQAFPVGSVFLSVVPTNPATLLGYGTWVAIASGQMLVGFNASDPSFDVAEETGGSKTTTIGATNVPQLSVNITDPGHTHLTQRYPTATGGSSGFTIDASMSGTLADNTLPVKSATTGITATANNGQVAQPLNVLNPYFTVYVWKRQN